MADRMSERSYITGTAASGGTANVKTPVFDTAGFESIMFMAVASATNSSNRLAFRMSTASSSGGMSDATGEVSHTTTGVMVLDIHRPIKRYVRLVTSRGTQNAAVDSVIAYLYLPGNAPVAFGSTVQSTPEFFNSPASGTA